MSSFYDFNDLEFIDLRFTAAQMSGPAPPRNNGQADHMHGLRIHNDNNMSILFDGSLDLPDRAGHRIMGQTTPGTMVNGINPHGINRFDHFAQQSPFHDYGRMPHESLNNLNNFHPGMGKGSSGRGHSTFQQVSGVNHHQQNQQNKHNSRNRFNIMNKPNQQQQEPQEKGKLVDAPQALCLEDFRGSVVDAAERIRELSAPGGPLIAVRIQKLVVRQFFRNMHKVAEVEACRHGILLHDGIFLICRWCDVVNLVNNPFLHRQSAMLRHPLFSMNLRQPTFNMNLHRRPMHLQ